MEFKVNQVICRSTGEILFGGAIFCPATDSIEVFGLIINKQRAADFEADISSDQDIPEIMTSLGVIAHREIRSMSTERKGFQAFELADAITAELPTDWTVSYLSPVVTIWNNPEAPLCENCFFDLVNTFYVHACLQELETRCKSAESNHFIGPCMN